MAHDEHDRAPGEPSAASPKPLSVEKWTFSAGIIFFLPMALIYGFWSGWEPVGTVALFLLVGLYGLSGLYLFLLASRVDPRPEDDPTSDVADHAGEMGVFSPHSWWPLVLGFAAAVCFAGLAVGWWLLFIGVLIGAVGLVGHTYEFSRGQHAH